MFGKILEEKSRITIENGKLDFRAEYGKDNSCGSPGENDFIRRQDAILLLKMLNQKLSLLHEQYEKDSPKIAAEAMTANTFISYSIWCLRELDGVMNDPGSLLLEDQTLSNEDAKSGMNHLSMCQATTLYLYLGYETIIKNIINTVGNKNLSMPLRQWMSNYFKPMSDEFPFTDEQKALISSLEEELIVLVTQLGYSFEDSDGYFQKIGLT